MVESINYKDIILSDCRHIVFAVNCEGINDSGLAGFIAKNFWPDLIDTGKMSLGTVLSRTIGCLTFHACVIHTLEHGGWDLSPSYLRHCLNRIIPGLNEKVGIVMMGAGVIGSLCGANVPALLEIMISHSLPLHIFSLSDFGCREIIKKYNIPETTS